MEIVVNEKQRLFRSVPTSERGLTTSRTVGKVRPWVTTGRALLASSSLTLAAVQAAQAANTVFDSGSTTITSPDAITGTDSYVIGDTGTATVSVVNPGSLSSDYDLILGNQATGVGTLTTSGVVNLTANRIYIGLGGEGTLTVTDGGTITASGANRRVILGWHVGSKATVNLSGASTTLTAYDLVVSNSGKVKMTVSDGAKVTTEDTVYVAFNPYSSGVLTVTGTGSEVNAKKFNIGNEGDGTVNVSDGAKVTVTTDVSIAELYRGTGTMTISGTGSSVTSDRLYVGGTGEGTLNVLDGGSYTVTGTGKMYVGYVDGGTGTVKVDGPGSSISAIQLAVGWNGAATMTLSNAATTTITGDVFIGEYAPSTGTLNVTGSGSKLTADRIYVGDIGTGYLNVLNGGIVATTGTSKIYFGNTSAGDGHGTVSGTGSTLSAGEINIGWNDVGTLTVSDGGAVSSNAAISVGYNSGGKGSLTAASGGTVTVGGGAGVIQIAQLAGSTGAVNIGAAAGEAAASAGTLNVGSISFGAGDGTLLFNHTDSNYSFGVDVTGSGTIRSLAGVTGLTGDYSGFTGGVTVDGGLLSVDTSSFTKNAFTVNNGTLRVTSSVTSTADTVTMKGGSLFNTGSIDGTQYGVVFANGYTSSVTTSGTIDGDVASIHYAGDGNRLNILAGASFTTVVDYAGTSDNTTGFSEGSFVVPIANYLVGSNTVALDNNRQTILYSTPNTASGTMTVVDTGASASVFNTMQTVSSTIGATATDVLSIDVDRSVSSRVALAYDDAEQKSESQKAISTMVGDGLAVDPYGNLFWMRAFGGASFDDYSDTSAKHYGLALGVDHVFDRTRIGFMAGIGQLKSWTDSGTSEVDGNTAFAGFYLRQPLSGYMLDASVIAGGIFSDTTREVNSGTETARGSYDGWFVSPEIALSRAYVLSEGWTLTPRGSVRYTYGSFEGYSETGSTMNLTYDDRSAQALQGVFELKLSKEHRFDNGKSATVSFSAAALDTYNLGDANLNASMSGTDFSVSTMGDRNQVGGRLGLDAEFHLDEQTSMMVGFNASRYTDDSWAYAANAGFKLKF
ncbi:autotransporter domain-containing protein [Pleomorphomonas sp. JP5]|uniref:autotransporter outer membrane beta-barrel domain-containing protein n=1 Tax=Pleomorphomonas sp. JP5 TaxID=2942998 RepID=UPI0020447535|nr:autotransporter domain-containing protein [Pleomorphomonas sp. JP5]MCM5557110.1 autotransporter domain-containing protein [Pleomorphomonas sp. JP5]